MFKVAIYCARNEQKNECPGGESPKIIRGTHCFVQVVLKDGK